MFLRNLGFYLSASDPWSSLSRARLLSWDTVCSMAFWDLKETTCGPDAERSTDQGKSSPTRYIYNATSMSKSREHGEWGLRNIVKAKEQEVYCQSVSWKWLGSYTLDFSTIWLTYQSLNAITKTHTKREGGASQELTPRQRTTGDKWLRREWELISSSHEPLSWLVTMKWLVLKLYTYK